MIDVFAERNIPIRTMERASGFISTEQLGVNNRESRDWADCGKTTRPIGTRVTEDGEKVKDYRIGADLALYNVLVRGNEEESTVKITVRWMAVTKAARADCSTKGTWEDQAEADIKQRAESSTAGLGPNPEPVAATVVVPLGNNWVADAGARRYYPAHCPAIAQIPSADRYFYSSEASVKAAGFKRAEAC